MKREHCITKDGSSSFIIAEWDEAYHSTHGAIQESQHIFIKSALAQIKGNKLITIMEYGFGTGLNALLTYYFAKQNNLKIFYNSIEKYPLKSTEYNKLNYEKIMNWDEGVLLKMHNSDWHKEVKISDFFSIKKIKSDFKNSINIDKKYDIVYFDAFNPDLQPELWTKEIFEKIYQKMNNKALFITYSVKGIIKRNLKSAGFKIEKIPGPIGKREILRAYK